MESFEPNFFFHSKVLYLEKKLGFGGNLCTNLCVANYWACSISLPYTIIVGGIIHMYRCSLGLSINNFGGKLGIFENLPRLRFLYKFLCQAGAGGYHALSVTTLNFLLYPEFTKKLKEEGYRSGWVSTCCILNALKITKNI